MLVFHSNRVYGIPCPTGWVRTVQIRPLEESYKFGAFFSSLLNESDFHAKPSVLLLGQYSTGAPAGRHSSAEQAQE